MRENSAHVWLLGTALAMLALRNVLSACFVNTQKKTEDVPEKLFSIWNVVLTSCPYKAASLNYEHIFLVIAVYSQGWGPAPSVYSVTRYMNRMALRPLGQVRLGQVRLIDARLIEAHYMSTLMSTGDPWRHLEELHRRTERVTMEVVLPVAS